MTAFSSLLTAFRASAPNYEIEIDENWKQGRTAYGGLTASLLHEAIVNSYTNLPPLRTVQINFVGPTDGKLQISHKMLRRDKNNVTFEAHLDSDAGPGTYGYFTFGISRQMTQEIDYPKHPLSVKPQMGKKLIPHNAAPNFLTNFDRIHATGPELLSGADNPDITVWSRHVDPYSHEGVTALIALTDAPPAALTALTQLNALSSMNWNINMLRDNPTTTNGWFLLRTATKYIRHGYSSQEMQVWNNDGDRIMDCIQHIAIFT
jgi:acyl-CoA thioesterase